MIAGFVADDKQSFENLKDVSMQVVKHRMNALRKKGKIKIGPLTEEYVHCCEAEHKIIL